MGKQSQDSKKAVVDRGNTGQNEGCKWTRSRTHLETIVNQELPGSGNQNNFVDNDPQGSSPANVKQRKIERPSSRRRLEFSGENNNANVIVEGRQKLSSTQQKFVDEKPQQDNIRPGTSFQRELDNHRGDGIDLTVEGDNAGIDFNNMIEDEKFHSMTADDSDNESEVVISSASMKQWAQQRS